MVFPRSLLALLAPDTVAGDTRGVLDSVVGEGASDDLAAGQLGHRISRWSSSPEPGWSSVTQMVLGHRFRRNVHAVKFDRAICAG